MLTHTMQDPRTEQATLAGGCFWCMQPPFEHIPGVTSVVVGYANGDGSPATYDTYASKNYVEAVQITFDPTTISYAQLRLWSRVTWLINSKNSAAWKFDACETSPALLRRFFARHTGNV